MTRNGITQGSPSLVSSLSYLLGDLDFLFVVGTVFSLLALLFTFDAVAGEREAGTLRITLANGPPKKPISLEQIDRWLHRVYRSIYSLILIWFAVVSGTRIPVERTRDFSTSPESNTLSR